MKRFFKLLILCGLFISIYFLWNLFLKPKELISPISKKIISNIPPLSTIIPTKKIPTTVLGKAINAVLDDATGTYGIVIKNLKTGENYYLNEHRVFATGSLYKLWVMAEVFDQIQSGKIIEDEVLTDSIEQLNNDFDIDKENAELTDGSITLSVKNALNQMITISHNYAAMLLTKRIELSSLSSFLVSNGFIESMVGEPPQTTAYDAALFFEKLYKKQLANAENTDKMMNLLKKQTLNNKLPKYLPQNIEIAHKTGEINYLSHDAGIVFSDSGNYIIAILSESDSPKGAEERIALVSQAVYKYFSGK